MKKETIIKHLKAQIKKEYPKANFCIGDTVRIKNNAKSFQIGKYKNWKDDEHWKEGLIVNYGDLLKKLKNKKFIIISLNQFEHITPKKDYCIDYGISDGKRIYHIYEDELIKN